ncbi:Protein Wfdc11, partial [Manis pentadactyla]
EIPLPLGAVLSLLTILGSQQTAGERPPRRAPSLQGTWEPLPASLEVSNLCKTAIQSQSKDQAFCSTSTGTMAGSDALDKPIDTTTPPLAVVFRFPEAPHETMGSTTAGLLWASDDHHVGGLHLVFPGPIRCHGRHR